MKEGYKFLPGTGRGTSRRLVEGAGHKRCDRVGHRTGIRHYAASGNSHHAETLFVQEAQTEFVALWPIGAIMYLAIDFDNQPRFPTVEVDDIRPDRVLTTEFGT